MISKNVRGWCVLQHYDAARQSEGQYFTHKEQVSRNKTRYLTKLGLLLVFTTVLVTTLSLLQCLAISLLSDHSSMDSCMANASCACL